MGEGEGLFAFTAGATGTAMFFTPFVAAPRPAVVHSQGVAPTGDVALGDLCVGGIEADVFPRSCLHGLVHRLYKGKGTVGVDGVVARMVGHHDPT